MKIQRQTKNKRRSIAVSILVVALISALFAYLYFYVIKHDNSSPIGSDSSPMSTSESDDEQTKNLQDNPEDKGEAPNTDHPPTPVVTSDSEKKQVQMIASTDRSGTTLFIRGGVNYPVVDGSCYALLTGPSGQAIRKDSSILSNPASADCKTISIPLSELASGEWSFTLHYTSDGYEGVSNEISFTI